ncbi:MAG: FHA domain-containing protein [Anaerolineae bacterium]|nr:FHA domain-containing protein [Anaerolineae bacterium]
MGNDSEGDVPMLVMLGPVAARYPLVGHRVNIGRDPENDIVIPDRRVSRRHAEVVLVGSDFVLRDCESKNGTFVNGERVVQERRLQDGDEIQVALCCQMVFVGPGATAPLSVGQAVRDERGLNLSLDVAARRVWVGGVEVDPPLSPAQFRLLQLLWEGRGRVVSREEIVASVWPGESDEGVSEQAIDALVRRLKERLGAYGAEGLVVTVRGHGFRLREPVEG